MRAITVAEFGDPSVLTPVDIPAPALRRGQLLVSVTGAGVGPWDAKARRGMYGPREFPYIPGAELSGVVEEVGANAEGFAVGDTVYASTGSGAYAEMAVVQADRTAHVPTTLDLVDAGAAAIGIGTAMEALDDHLHLAPGDTVLIAGAAGGMGTFAVQIAKARGARVIATASPPNHDFLRGIGADEVLDYHGDWVEAAKALTVDAALDCVGASTWDGCVAALRDGGRAVSILRTVSLETDRDVTLSTFAARITGERLAEGTGLIDEGRVRVEISARLPLDDAVKAHEMIETGHTRGKIVLVP
ncbi:MAG TPA: NADP-dependent oxidoreductase [Acidimicrobiales bacterium]|nr:NADP-dependent oxidoreductase [Acidimicrobiales bacterium]